MGIEALLSTQIIDTTTVGRAVMTAADAAAARTAIGAGTSSFSGAYSALSGIPSTFAPSAHKTSHATGGSDALTAADIGAAATSHTHAASDITSGILATARLATGTASASTYLRGDQTWASVTGGVGGSTGSVDNAVLRADGTGGSTVQNSGLTISDTLEMRIGDATNAGKLRLQDSGQYSTANLFSVFLGGGFIGQDIATFTLKGNGEVYSYQGYTCSSAGSGFVGHQFVFDGGWGSIQRAVGTPTGNGNRISNTYGLYVTCGAGHGFSVAAGTSTTFIDVFNTFTNSTNYEKAILRFATYSSARYVQLACESLGTGIANMNLVLSPKGTGALIAGPMPDGTAVGGNARGNNAVDLCIGAKGSATNVASGNNSFLGPQGGTASGAGAVAFGGTASGNYSFVFPGGTTVSGVGAIGGYVVSGSQTVSGLAACAFGSSSSAVSGSRSFLLAGDFSVVSGDACFSHGYLPGAGGPTVAGTGNFCTAGGAASSTASWALSCGQSAQVRHPGQRAFAAGRFAAVADAQGCEWVLRNKTTDGTTAVTLFLDGSSARLTIPSGKILFATAQVVGSKSDGTAVAIYMRKFAIKNVGGTTTLVGSVETIGTDVAAGTSLSITADDTNDAVNPAVIGVSGETWRWVMTVYGVELAYGT